MSFKLQSRIPQVNAQLRRRASALVRNTAFGIVANIQVSMTETKHGAIYKRKRREHQASAPGEAPAVDEGNLIDSIQTTMNGDLSATVGTNVEYAEILEFGGARMAARPFMGPAFERAEPEFRKKLKELVK